MVSFEYTGKVEAFTKGYIMKAKKFRGLYIKFETLYPRPIKGTETVEYYLFNPKSDPVGILFILHGLGTSNIPFLLWMATHLANAGVRVVFPILPGNFTRVADNSVSGKDFFDTDVERATMFWEQSVIDVSSIVDHIKAQGLWVENAYMFGFCLGGMVSVMINAIRDDFKRTIMMTVGGEMATLMWSSPTLEYFRKSVESMKDTGKIKYSIGDMRKMKEIFREQLKELQKFETVEEMQKSDIHPYLKLDPIAYAQFVDRDKIIFVEALFDKALPLRSRRLLWEALGRPTKYIIPSGHVTWLPLQFFVARFILENMGISEFKKQMEVLRKIEYEEKK
ncbi:MAG TPA: alpha/beta hydrolase [Fervidobacterium sp.]|nr:alpha/beta hydrolase [Fervidobacterium sp.]HOK88369.1 alpha/beta hydrolase [Fervidobacterium sp.]HOM74862.1 alpha/beta hydrolase [Fervidobacterium sp.]HOQ40449.1 alpha/beta hydrolase [Fervidobacterium sp.]HPP18339.1 alpha/beta hydrolase [Fervidobacterium sp.]